LFEFLEVWTFLNESQFVRTVLASLAGAGLGAWTAQRIAARNKDNEEILKDVRASNVAASIAYGITEAFVSVKKQHVKPLCDGYKAEKAALLAFRPTPGNNAYNFNADLRTLAPVKSPIDHLQKAVFERVSASTKVVSLVGVLDRTLHGLDLLITTRNDLVEEFKANSPVNHRTYFGLPTTSGSDERYSSTIKHLSEYTDDAIYFSKLIGDELVKHGNLLKKKLPRKMQLSAPIIASADYSKAGDLMPAPSNYQDWDTMFQQAFRAGPGFWHPAFTAMADAQA
jgi:hypothetical protein